MKKLLAIILSGALMLTILPIGLFNITASAYTEYKEGFYTYTVYNNGQAEITDVNNSITGDIIIPSTLGGYDVVSIGHLAFQCCYNITSVVIPDGIRYIGGSSLEDGAFSFCSSLQSVTIGKDVEYIGEYAFYGCGTLTTLNFNAINCKFMGGFNESTDIGGEIETPFMRCPNLKTINIGESVTSLPEYAFYFCDSTVKVNIRDMEAWCKIKFASPNSNPLYKQGKLFLNGIFVTNYTLPDNITSIGSYAFYNYIWLENLTIPDSVIEVGDLAFYNNPWIDKLSEGPVYIGNTLYKYIGDCPSNFKIKEGITSILAEAFYGCNLLSNVIIPESVALIGDNAFSNCSSLTNITIPKSVTSIGNSAFSNCSALLDVNFYAENCTFMGNGYYEDDWFEELSFNHSVFSGCRNLKTVNIGNSVRIIPKHAFSECSTLTSITIPESVVLIDSCAFSNCSKLKNIYYQGSVRNKGCIEIKEYGNEYLIESTWHFGKCTESEEHSYDNSCDISCNGCGETRNITHSYKTITTKATLTKNGSEVQKCTVCGKVASTTIIKYAKTIKLSATSYTYDGKVKKPSVVVIDSSGKTLIKDTDYAVTYPSGCKSVGTYNVIVTMQGNYTGRKTLTFTINPPKTSATLTAGKKALTVNIAKKTSQVTGYEIQYSTTKDFKSYKTKNVTSYKTTNVTLNSLKANQTYYVRVRTYKTIGNKRYYSEWSIIKCKTVKDALEFELSTTSYVYDGKVKTPSVTVKDSTGKTLKKNTDYTVTYASGRKNAGTYKVTIKMIGKYEGTKTLYFKIKPINISKCELILSKTSYTYDGKSKIPSVIVLNHNGTKLTGSSYTATYASGRKNVGAYKVTIKGQGNYSGTKTLTFKINPPKTSATLTAGKKALTVKIAKKSTQVTGYQIQYSTSKKFTSAKTKTVTSYKTTKVTLKSLKAKKTYYVRVRTYKTVKGVKYYSGWSTVKSVKTK